MSVIETRASSRVGVTAAAPWSSTVLGAVHFLRRCADSSQCALRVGGVQPGVRAGLPAEKRHAAFGSRNAKGSSTVRKSEVARTPSALRFPSDIRTTRLNPAHSDLRRKPIEGDLLANLA